MLEIFLHTNEVGGYTYNDANTLFTHIEGLLEWQVYEGSADEMKGLASNVINALNK